MTKELIGKRTNSFNLVWKKFIECIAEAENDDTIIQIERRFAKELIDAHEIQYKLLLETEKLLDDMRVEIIKQQRVIDSGKTSR